MPVRGSAVSPGSAAAAASLSPLRASTAAETVFSRP